MQLRLQTESLKETQPGEYLSRFLFGGLVTMLAGFAADRFGPVIGGLLLAFPGIFPVGVSLVEDHKLQRERAEGKVGTRSARGEASVEAAGASVGALGLIGFAVVLWRGLAAYSLPWVLLTALAVWTGVSWLFWRVRERM